MNGDISCSNLRGNNNFLSLATSGNVGINNANPTSALDVSGNTNITGTLAVSLTTTLTGNVAIKGVPNASNALLVTGSQSNTGDVFIGGTTRLSGNVGIGKTATVALDVSGTTNIAGTLTTTSVNTQTPGMAIMNLSNTTNVNQLTLVGGVTTQGIYSPHSMVGDSVIRSEGTSGLCLSAFTSGGLRIGANGYVGVNSNSPRYNLDVSGTLNVAGTATFVNTSNDGTLKVTGLATFVNTINTGTLEVTGNVGIKGVPNSSNALLVTGSQSNTGDVFIGGITTMVGSSNTGNLGVFGTTTLSGNVAIKGVPNTSNALLVTGTQSNTSDLFIGGTSRLSGNVGIGKDPSVALDVSGNINFTGTLNSNGNPVSFSAAGINSSGNVGINKAATSYPLDVSGNARIVGNTIYIGKLTNAYIPDASGVAQTQIQPLANLIRFYGTSGDIPGGYQSCVIGENTYKNGTSTESSELILFKANDGDDRVRVLASGGFQVDITGGSYWIDGSSPPEPSIAGALVVNSAGNVGIGTTSPSYKLHVVGDIYSSGNVTAYSDVRAKENIVTIDSPLDKIMKMRGVYYTRKDMEKKRQVGVIAQEIEEVLPEVVMTDATENKNKSVAYGNIVALLIEGMKAQQSTIDSLLTRI